MVTNVRVWKKIYWDRPIRLNITLEHSASDMRDRSQSSGLTGSCPNTWPNSVSQPSLSQLQQSLLLCWPITKACLLLFSALLLCQSLFCSFACNTGLLQQFCLHYQSIAANWPCLFENCSSLPISAFWDLFQKIAAVWPAIPVYCSSLNCYTSLLQQSGLLYQSIAAVWPAKPVYCSNLACYTSLLQQSGLLYQYIAAVWPAVPACSALPHLCCTKKSYPVFHRAGRAGRVLQQGIAEQCWAEKGSAE